MEVDKIIFGRFFRLGGSAGIASGIFFILAALALFTSILVSDIPALVFATLVLFANVLIAFTIMAIYIVQIKESGNEGVAGFVLSMIGLLLDLANFFDPLGSILFIIGLTLLAFVNTRSGRLPTLALWLWVAAAVLSLPFVLLGWRLLIGLALIISGAIRIWLGVALRLKTVAGMD
ncbi:MAG TPA: hypothetical protein G4O11_08650 [Anaerolineae bacterium]|nr:MAG: hypothetical protein AMJ88_18895 [Anaerolineae bacterium SM23_ 63]HEY44035.1 hypothetical protein [Anaerolineae bacterium]